jgi:hypothetical protein
LSLFFYRLHYYYLPIHVYRWLTVVFEYNFSAKTRS